MKKIVYSALSYSLIIIIIRFSISPEHYIYGHSYENKFLEFLFAVVAIPVFTSLFYLAKTTKKDKSIAIGILFTIFGFIGLLTSTFIEKSIVSYQLNKDAKTIIGVVDYRYLERSRSRSNRITYNFIVSFTVNNKTYNSLPGFTKTEIYNIGDSIKVNYLERNPFLNKIIYSKE